MLWLWLEQRARSFPGPWRFLPKAGPGGQDPLAWFRLRDPECRSPRRLRPPQRATLWTFASLVGGLPLRSHCVRHFAGLLRRRPREILRPPRLRPLLLLRSSPPFPPFGPRLCRAWGLSDPERRTVGARGLHSPDNTLPRIRLAGALGACGCARSRFRPPGP